MTDWKRILRALAPNARADIVATFIALDGEIERAGITTDERRAQFLANIVHESQGLSRLEEGLSYKTAERICEVWPSRFPTEASARPYVRNPKKLAEKVYGGRMGNVRPGDGWLYRGGGLAGTTGRNNYRAAGFEDRPDDLRTPKGALRAALTFWVDNRCAAYADRRDTAGLRAVWNGGAIGLAEVKDLVEKARRVLTALPAQQKLKALRLYDGAVDGDAGDRTVGAVQLLQRKSGLPVTGELDEPTLAALDEADPLPVAAKDANLAKSRTVQGAGVAGSFGIAEIVQSAGELKDQAENAKAQISAGTVFGFVMGGLIVAGALVALYARWDDAGRPVPGFLARRFPRLTGAA